MTSRLIQFNKRNMSVLWQKLYNKWKMVRMKERGQKLDFASAVLIMVQSKKRKRSVQFNFNVVIF